MIENPDITLLVKHLKNNDKAGWRLLKDIQRICENAKKGKICPDNCGNCEFMEQIIRREISK